ncbi:hypothetical protein TH53_01900 [Pedobacter lusitanus]|uniref:Uncharacterized protein n=1 Tax=Pedobacter lusitanus TaxID=1503925 RepID=A0A0D0G1K0_9SPHI|nr:alpha/beta hydrolase-fold protein [Pedobacter lusitanus]KIO78674.1 hypothetical protein TH53_01900 [Pedobacter lusitanus]
MNAKILKQIVAVALLFLIKTAAIAQIPVNNPYFTKYNSVNHWTDNLPWKNTVNAVKIPGLIDEKGRVDSLTLSKTMKDISDNGGGVLFFPKGKYYLNADVELFSGVILRGADPETSKNGINEDYKPPTQFLFPQYLPSFTGKGTPDNTAFKTIHAGKVERENFGVVNIDVNRARLDFANVSHNNVIVFGVRSNNAANCYSPYCNVDGTQAWVRFPNIYNNNIAIYSKNNALIANCRINDAITDDFAMPNIMTNDGDVFTKDTVKFQYSNQSAILMKEGEMSNKENKIEVLDNFAACGKPAIYKINLETKNGISRGNVLGDIALQNLVVPNGFYSKKIQESVSKLFLKEVYIKNGKDTLYYQLLKPRNYDPKKKYPLVLFFHGIGERGVNNNPLVHFVQTFTKEEIADQYPCFVLVPHLVKMTDEWTGNEGNINSPPQPSLQMSIEVVNKLKKEYSIDNKKMYVAGVSTGGHAVLDVLLRYPKLFNNAIVMSYLFPLTEKQYKVVKNASFYISAGKYDPDIPVEYMRLVAQNLRFANAKVKYFEYETTHMSWLYLCTDPKFLGEMFKKN